MARVNRPLAVKVLDVVLKDGLDKGQVKARTVGKAPLNSLLAPWALAAILDSDILFSAVPIFLISSVLLKLKVRLEVYSVFCSVTKKVGKKSSPPTNMRRNTESVTIYPGS